MDLDSPGRLLLLVAVAGLAVAYAVQQVRRRRLQRAWADEALLASSAPRRPGVLRHLPPALVLLSLVAMTVAVAEPRREREVQRERATVVVALDTSTSMLAQDVTPDRITAAREAAARFVDGLPEGFDVALVGFNGAATLHVPATDDHQAVTQAVAGLRLSGGTALGDAVVVSLSALETPEDEAVGAVVLLADGGSTLGTPVPEAVRRAAEAGVPVSTIAYGTAGGQVVLDGQTFPVPVDEQVLTDIAEGTGGQAYTAATGEELEGVYEAVRARLSTTTERQDVSAVAAGVALALLVAAAAAAGVDRSSRSVS